MHETMAEVCAENGIRQLHVAETEKYAHVTYFFNGGREDEWQGETRILVPSPRDVPSYDHKPEMSVAQVAEEFDNALAEDGYGFAIVNLANPDMVGHTGSIPAAVKAVEATDEALGDDPRRGRAGRRGRARDGGSRKRGADARRRGQAANRTHLESRTSYCN